MKKIKAKKIFIVLIVFLTLTLIFDALWTKSEPDNESKSIEPVKIVINETKIVF